MLPPIQDALYLHMERANFQSYEWNNALENNGCQDPEGHGWDKKGCSTRCWMAQTKACPWIGVRVCFLYVQEKQVQQWNVRLFYGWFKLHKHMQIPQLCKQNFCPGWGATRRLKEWQWRWLIRWWSECKWAELIAQYTDVAHSIRR